MILDPTWLDVLLRLALTMAAGAVVGINREVHGHSAGFRTTILVGLAACVTMIHANLLLTTTGKASDSFVNIDVLRLPLGILTGVGFIGGGAIFRRGNLVTGVTTAATLWAITAIGLCFGSGSLLLGILATLFTVVTIWLLKWIEYRIPREHRAMIVIDAVAEEALPDLSSLLEPAGYRSRFVGVRSKPDNARASIAYEIRWRRADIGEPQRQLFGLVAPRYRIESFDITTDAGHDS